MFLNKYMLSGKGVGVEADVCSLGLLEAFQSNGLINHPVGVKCSDYVYKYNKLEDKSFLKSPIIRKLWMIKMFQKEDASPLQWMPVRPRALGHSCIQTAYGHALVVPHSIGCVFFL